MSLIQNDIYNEYMYENNICTICLKEIRIELRDDGTTQGEWNSQVHDNTCILNGVEDNAEAIQRRIEYGKKPFIMPKITQETIIANKRFDREHEPKYRYE